MTCSCSCSYTANSFIVIIDYVALLIFVLNLKFRLSVNQLRGPRPKGGCQKRVGEGLKANADVRKI